MLSMSLSALLHCLGSIGNVLKCIMHDLASYLGERPINIALELFGDALCIAWLCAVGAHGHVLCLARGVLPDCSMARSLFAHLLVLASAAE